MIESYITGMIITAIFMFNERENDKICSGQTISILACIAASLFWFVTWGLMLSFLITDLISKWRNNV